MGATVWCHYCKKSHYYLDDANWGFDCVHCGKHNEEDTYKWRTE